VGKVLEELLSIQSKHNFEIISSYGIPILEQVALCGEAIGLNWTIFENSDIQNTIRFLDGDAELGNFVSYWPIENDQQAMELVKYFMLNVNGFTNTASFNFNDLCTTTSDDSLNHAIVECVAKYVKNNYYL
jgi:hypothetical protein